MDLRGSHAVLMHAELTLRTEVCESTTILTQHSTQTDQSTARILQCVELHLPPRRFAVGDEADHMFDGANLHRVRITGSGRIVGQQTGDQTVAELLMEFPEFELYELDAVGIESG